MLNKKDIYKEYFDKCFFCLVCYVSIKRYFYSIKEILFGLIYDVKFLKGLIVMGDGLVIFDLEVF